MCVHKTREINGYIFYVYKLNLKHITDESFLPRGDNIVSQLQRLGFSLRSVFVFLDHQFMYLQNRNSSKGTNSFFVERRKRISKFLKTGTGPWDEFLLILKGL